MDRSLATLLALSLLVASAGCLGVATGPLHPPGGPGDEQVGPATPDERVPDGQVPADGDHRTPEPTPQAVQIPDFDFAEGTSGNVVVELTVENTGNESRSVELVAAVDINGTTKEAASRLTLAPGQRTTVGIRFDGDWEEFQPNLEYARVRPITDTAAGS